MSCRRIVAVTGATGFLGWHLVLALARQVGRIRILARRQPIHGFWGGINVEVVLGGLEDVSAVERLVDGADAIIHAAGLIKARGPAEYIGVNRDGTRAVALAALQKASEARFIMISSLAAREPQLSAYSASKFAGEQAARTVYHDRLHQLVIVRPPVIYGPGDRATLAIFKAASRTFVPVFGLGRTAIVHVEDAATAIARLALGIGGAGLYTLADDRPTGYSSRELMAEAASAVGCKPHFVYVPDNVLLTAGGMSSLWARLSARPSVFNLGKAREMLHPNWAVSNAELLPDVIYRSRIGIAEGFRTTVDWYKGIRWLV